MKVGKQDVKDQDNMKSETRSTWRGKLFSPLFITFK